jgi:hypothetical protein
VDTTRIKQGSPSGRIEVDLPPEPLAGILVTIDGVTASGEDLNADRVGRFRIKRGGEQLQGEDAGFYYDLANINRGYPTDRGGTGEQSHLAVPIPFGLDGLPNVLDVFSNEEADLILDFTQGDLGTVFGTNSATYQVTGLVAPTVPERYELRVQESNIQSTGAGRQPGEFSARNVAEIYLNDPDSVVEEVQIDIDDAVVQDTISDKVLQDLTNLFNEVETAGLDTRQVVSPDRMSIGNTLNDRVSYDVKFSGQGSAKFTLLQTRFNNQRIEQSAERVQRVAGNKRENLAASASGTPQGAVTR